MSYLMGTLVRMASKVENLEMAAAIDMIAAGFLALRQAGTVPANARDAVGCITEFEQLRRVADAACVDLLGSISENRFHAADGHASAKAMVRHLARLSSGEALARSRSVAMFVDLPDIADAYQNGLLGTDQVRAIAGVHANPRVRHAMSAKQAAFLNEANTGFDTFNQRLQQWKRLTDADGPTPPNEKNHQDRNARVDQDFDLAWHVVARFASQQGLQVSEIFNKYVEAETLADWEKARAEHGDAATADHLPRTIQNRRADALWQVFIDAAANPNSSVPLDFVHNIVWDAETFEAMAAKVLAEDAGIDLADCHEDDTCSPVFGEADTDDVDAGDVEASLFDGIDPDTMVCRTVDGVPVEPTEMMINALVSKIRRVVITAAGEKVDLGKARFFTGMARHAVKLKATHCVWPGCRVPSSGCQADHLDEYSAGGRTNPGNGAPLCGKHNRHKHQGFTIHRTPDGVWHIIRPDGTEIPT